MRLWHECYCRYFNVRCASGAILCMALVQCPEADSAPVQPGEVHVDVDECLDGETQWTVHMEQGSLLNFKVASDSGGGSRGLQRALLEADYGPAKRKRSKRKAGSMLRLSHGGWPGYLFVHKNSITLDHGLLEGSHSIQLPPEARRDLRTQLRQRTVAHVRYKITVIEDAIGPPDPLVL